MRSQTLVNRDQTLDGLDEAIGFTVQQHLFALGMTRAALGQLIGVPGQSVSSRLRGKVRWTAGDLVIAAEAFGVEVEDLYPTRAADGSWAPAPYVPGTRKSPAPAGAGDSALVAGTGFEPATSGFPRRLRALIDRLVCRVETAELRVRYRWRLSRTLALRTNTSVASNADNASNAGINTTPSQPCEAVSRP